MAYRVSDAEEERSSPLICKSCSGPKPYSIPLEEKILKECKICMQSFPIFRWFPIFGGWGSGKNASRKMMEICYKCAKLKKVCQVCLSDYEAKMPPVPIRYAELGIRSSGPSPIIQIPIHLQRQYPPLATCSNGSTSRSELPIQLQLQYSPLAIGSFYGSTTTSELPYQHQYAPLATGSNGFTTRSDVNMEYVAEEHNSMT